MRFYERPDFDGVLPVDHAVGGGGGHVAAARLEEEALGGAGTGDGVEGGVISL